VVGTYTLKTGPFPSPSGGVGVLAGVMKRRRKGKKKKKEERYKIKGK
jgi:hypothetical protein